MKEYSLWHLFALNYANQAHYCGSRFNEEQAKRFYDELKYEIIDSEFWKDIYYCLAEENYGQYLPHKFEIETLKTEQRTALHEAGHAVAAIQLGLDLQDIGSVTVVPKAQMNGSFSINEMQSNIFEVHRDIVINCSGYGALRALGFPEDYACTGCDDDFDKSEILIANWKLTSLNYWKNLATKFLSIPKNASALQVVADSLIKYKILGPEYTQILIRAELGLYTHDFLEDFKVHCQQMGQSYWLL